MFGIISVLFFAGIYSSSTQIFAVENNYVMSCSYTKDKKTSFCSDNDPTNNDVWRCDKQKMELGNVARYQEKVEVICQLILAKH